MSKGKGGAEAERLVEAWLQLTGWTTHRAAATGFTKFAKKGGGSGFAVKSHDLYGCVDILAFKLGGIAFFGDDPAQESKETVAVQVTTQSGRSHRRAKLEVHQWPSSWRVCLVSHETTPDPAHRGKRLHFLKVEDLICGDWLKAKAIPVDVKACEAHRKALRSLKKGLAAAERQADAPKVFDE